MRKRGIFLVILLSVFIMFSLVSAEFGYNIFPPKSETTNFSLVNVNSSDFWDNLDVPLVSWLSTYNETYNSFNSSYWVSDGENIYYSLGNVNITKNLTTQDTYIGNFFRALTGNLITFFNNVLFDGNVTADYFIGDGAGLRNINQSLTYDIDSNKVLWVPFEAGSQTRDHSGFQNDGTVINATWNATGGYDGFGAYEFDGDGDYINYGSISSISGASELTVSTWIKVKGLKDFSYHDIISKTYPGSDSYRSFAMACETSMSINGSLVILLWNETDFGSLASSNNYICANYDVWQNFVFTYDNSIINLYIDGEYDTSVAFSGNIRNTTSPVFIGNGFFSDRYFNGTIDEVTIWNRSLSAEEIKRLYEKRKVETSFQDDITMGSNLDVTGNFTGNQIYAEVWYHNHTATSLTFGTDGLFYNLTLDNSDLNGFTFNDAEDSITPLVDGKYKVSWMASGDGANNEEYYTTILVNGADYDRCEAHKKMTAGGDIVTMTGNCFVDLVTTDYVQLGTANIGGTSTGNYYSATLNLVRIGD